MPSDSDKIAALEEEVRDQARVIAAAYARADEYERYANYNAELIEGRDATIAELQATLDQLPKTADGFVGYIGMTVYMKFKTQFTITIEFNGREIPSPPQRSMFEFVIDAMHDNMEGGRIRLSLIESGTGDTTEAWEMSDVYKYEKNAEER